jgi:hypothetical protein
MSVDFVGRTWSGRDFSISRIFSFSLCIIKHNHHFTWGKNRLSFQNIVFCLEYYTIDKVILIKNQHYLWPSLNSSVQWDMLQKPWHFFFCCRATLSSCANILLFCSTGMHFTHTLHIALCTHSPAETKNFSSSHCVPDVHPVSCPIGTGGLFLEVKHVWGVMLATDPYLVLRSWMSRGYISSPLCHLLGSNGTALFYFLSI